MKKTAAYRYLGELRDTPYVVYQNNLRIDSDSWDETLWIESSEDLYALNNPIFKDKRVRVVRKVDWKKSPIIIEPNLKCPI